MSGRAGLLPSAWPPPWCQTPVPHPRLGSFSRFVLCTNHLSSLGQVGRGAAGGAHSLPVPFPSRTGAVSWSPAWGLDPSWL